MLGVADETNVLNDNAEDAVLAERKLTAVEAARIYSSTGAPNAPTYPTERVVIVTRRERKAPESPQH